MSAADCRRLVREAIRHTVDHDSNSRDSDDDFRTSTIITVAQRHACFATVVDELAVRLCSLAQLPDQFATTGHLPERDSLPVWSDIVNETNHWWADHGLGELTNEQCRGLVAELLSRGPLEGAPLLLGVCSSGRHALLNRSEVETVQQWNAAIVATHRVLAQALAFMVLAPWIAREPVERIGMNLVARVQQGTLDDVNSTLLVCLGLLQMAPERTAPLILDVLLNVARRPDLERIDLLGGLIGRLWALLPGQVEDWLGENCGRLARRVFRLAVERLPAQKRKELTQQWKNLRSNNPARDRS
jgi:hypothetical protein